MRQNKLHNDPVYKLPVSWQMVGESLVCSFKCAYKTLRKKSDKTVTDKLRENFSHAMSIVGV